MFYVFTIFEYEYSFSCTLNAGQPPRCLRRLASIRGSQKFDSMDSIASAVYRELFHQCCRHCRRTDTTCVSQISAVSNLISKRGIATALHKKALECSRRNSSSQKSVPSFNLTCFQTIDEVGWGLHNFCDCKPTVMCTRHFVHQMSVATGLPRSEYPGFSRRKRAIAHGESPRQKSCLNQFFTSKSNI